jgi:hypothetical protein
VFALCSSFNDAVSNGAYTVEWLDGREQWIEINAEAIVAYFNLLTTKGRLLYLKTQFVPRSKHFSSRLQKPII